MPARGPVVHENVEVVAIAPELGFDDVAGVSASTWWNWGSTTSEHGRVVDDRAIDTALAGRIFVDNFVFAAKRFELLDHHFDNLAVFRLRTTPRTSGPCHRYLQMIFAEVLDFDGEPFLGPMLGRLGREFFVTLTEELRPCTASN